MLDWAAEQPVPPPFTTIAWRIAHIGSVVLAARAANHFGDGFDLAAVRWPGTAQSGLDYLRDLYRDRTKGKQTSSTISTSTSSGAYGIFRPVRR